MKQMKRITLLILLVISSLSLSAVERDSSAFVHRIGVDLRPALILQQNDFFRGTNRYGRPMVASGSAHLQYSFMFPADSRLGKLYPTAYQGIGLAAYTFMNHVELGTPAALYVFQGAEIARFPYGLSLDYEWNFGVSFGWHPYSKDEGQPGANPNNLVVGTKTNAYINGALMLSWRPKPGWSLSAGLDYTHFSNGDTTFPNSGVNTIGLRVGATRAFGGLLPEERRIWGVFDGPDDEIQERFVTDVVICGAWNEEMVTYMGEEIRVDGKFGILALHVNPLYRLTRFLRVGASLDIQFSEGMNIQNHIAGKNPDHIKFYRPPLLEQLGTGLSLRAELEMPLFSVNFGVGHNFIYKGKELGGFYNILSLKAFVNDRIFLNIGLDITYTEASNNLLLGMGWRFGK